jgi:hypothetical protein
MAGISFGNHNESVWIVAGWAFRQVLKDLSNFCPLDATISSALVDAEHLGFLDVDALDEPFRSQITLQLEQVCLAILAGRFVSGVKYSPPDAKAESAYIEGIEMLLAAIESSKLQSNGES